MTLNEYLKENKLSVRAFSKLTDIPEATITKYKYKERIPRPDLMEKIILATNAQVTPNDWYMHKFNFNLKRDQF